MKDIAVLYDSSHIFTPVPSFFAAREGGGGVVGRRKRV